MNRLPFTVGDRDHHLIPYNLSLVPRSLHSKQNINHFISFTQTTNVTKAHIFPPPANFMPCCRLLKNAVEVRGAPKLALCHAIPQDVIRFASNYKLGQQFSKLAALSRGVTASPASCCSRPVTQAVMRPRQMPPLPSTGLQLSLVTAVAA